MANIGDRVLICDGYWENNVLAGTFQPKYGTVEQKYQSEDRSHHGSPMYDTITVVRGEDGKVYTDDSEQNFSRDWKKTPKFFTEKEFTGAIQMVIQKKEREIAAANYDIGMLKKQAAAFEYQKLDSLPFVGMKLEGVVQQLQEYNKQGQKVCVEVNGHMFYSDTVTMDSAYLAVTGHSKEAFHKVQEDYLEKWEEKFGELPKPKQPLESQIRSASSKASPLNAPSNVKQTSPER